MQISLKSGKSQRKFQIFGENPDVDLDIDFFFGKNVDLYVFSWHK